MFALLSHAFSLLHTSRGANCSRTQPLRQIMEQLKDMLPCTLLGRAADSDWCLAISILPIVRHMYYESVKFNMAVLHGDVLFPCAGLYTLTVGLLWFRCNVGRVDGILMLYMYRLWLLICFVSCEIGMPRLRVSTLPVWRMCIVLITEQFPQSEDFAPVVCMVRYMIMHSITLWGVAWISSLIHFLFPPCCNQSTCLESKMCFSVFNLPRLLHLAPFYFLDKRISDLVQRLAWTSSPRRRKRIQLMPFPLQAPAPLRRCLCRWLWGGRRLKPRPSRPARPLEGRRGRRRRGDAWWPQGDFDVASPLN